MHHCNYCATGRRFGLTSVLLLLTTCLSAQITTQSWVDFIMNVPMRKGFTFDNEFSYKTNISKTTKWRSYDITPEIEKALGKHFDLTFYVGASYTNQQAGYDTWEVKPGLGIRYNITPDKRLLLRLLARFETRNQYTYDSSVWDRNTRSRLRMEGIYLINKNSLAENRVWYVITDAEVFWTIDKQVRERYSDRTRIRAGIGFKLNAHWRFEEVYTYQFSRNTITEHYGEDQQQIFRLRVKYFTK